MQIIIFEINSLSHLYAKPYNLFSSMSIKLVLRILTDRSEITINMTTMTINRGYDVIKVKGSITDIQEIS
jgi:hypothetical protein